MPRVDDVRLLSIMLIAGGFLTVSPPGRAGEVTLSPSKDNTLFEGSPGVFGELSNGAGFYFYVGRNAQPTLFLRRGLLAFDLKVIPAGSTVESVSLVLVMSRTIAGDKRVALHRVTADWGEGTSNAEIPFIDRGGDGTGATTNDATWIHRFFPDQLWSTPGGDFVSEPSGVANVGAVGSYTWSSSGMVADVQAWLDHPENNFGWILIGDESTPFTAKRFGSRENQVAGERPQLTVRFRPSEPPPPDGGLQLPGDINQDGTLDISDAVATLGALFLGVPARLPCDDGAPLDAANLRLLDWQPDGVLDISDAVALLSFLFLDGRPHALAIPGAETTGCLKIIGCHDRCSGGA